jgi:DNA repair protein RadC
LVSADLLRRFKSAAATLAAPQRSLSRTTGMDMAAIAHLKAVRALALRMLGTRLQTRPLLNNVKRLLQFFDAAFGFDNRENLVVMYTDSACRMITYDLIRSGTVDHVPVYPRELVHRALDAGASGMIVVHNHSSGDPTPSADDLALTRTLGEACRLLDLTLHDHLIVASGRHISLREKGLL